jgi:hypothetical protein
VTSYSSQSQTVDRVLVNADANESDLLLNQRMGYVAVSRAREEAMIFTNCTEQLKTALDRSTDKESAVQAMWQARNQEIRSDREDSPLRPFESESVVQHDGYDDFVHTCQEDGNFDDERTSIEIDIGL